MQAIVPVDQRGKGIVVVHVVVRVVHVALEKALARKVSVGPAGHAHAFARKAELNAPILLWRQVGVVHVGRTHTVEGSAGDVAGRVVQGDGICGCLCRQAADGQEQACRDSCQFVYHHHTIQSNSFSHIRTASSVPSVRPEYRLRSCPDRGPGSQAPLQVLRRRVVVRAGGSVPVR